MAPGKHLGGIGTGGGSIQFRTPTPAAWPRGSRCSGWGGVGWVGQRFSGPFKHFGPLDWGSGGGGVRDCTWAPPVMGHSVHVGGAVHSLCCGHVVCSTVEVWCMVCTVGLQCKVHTV